MKLPALLFIAAFLLLTTAQSFAAFPIKGQNKFTNSVVEKNTNVNSFNPYIPPRSSMREDNEGGKGPLAMALAGAGLTTFVIGDLLLSAFSTSPALVLFIMGLFLGISAIVVGAKGLKSRNKGWAMAGMVLGIIEVSVAVVIGLIILLLALTFGGL